MEAITEYLKPDLLPICRFPNMSAIDFSSVAINGILDHNVSNAIFTYISLQDIKDERVKELTNAMEKLGKFLPSDEKLEGFQVSDMNDFGRRKNDDDQDADVESKQTDEKLVNEVKYQLLNKINSVQYNSKNSNVKNRWPMIGGFLSRPRLRTMVYRKQVMYTAATSSTITAAPQTSTSSLKLSIISKQCSAGSKTQMKKIACSDFKITPTTPLGALIWAADFKLIGEPKCSDAVGFFNQTALPNCDIFQPAGLSKHEYVVKLAARSYSNNGKDRKLSSSVAFVPGDIITFIYSGVHRQLCAIAPVRTTKGGVVGQSFEVLCVWKNLPDDIKLMPVVELCCCDSIMLSSPASGPSNSMLYACFGMTNSSSESF
jgi:hypothetical protein